LTLGQNIKKYRKQKGLTLKQVGNKLGMSEQAIGQYERGERQVAAGMLNKIADALGVTIGKLVEGIYDVKNYDNVIKHLNEAIQNIEKSILQEGYNPNLNYMKGNLDGLKIALKILINESEEI
jgi:transcriptional regulator with XRE-family HTH domain